MTNEILRSLWNRKSVRAYRDEPISDKSREAIIQAAIQAPTAGNMQLYSIINVTDAAKKQQLAVLCDNQPFIALAPLALVFVADWQKWYDSFKILYGDNVRKPRSGDLWLAMNDALIAAQNAVVAAESLGIGSCYIGDIIENCEGVQALLNLPQFVVPTALLCFGYPTEQQSSRQKPARVSSEFVVSENSYKQLDEAQLREMFASAQGKSDAFDRQVSGLYKRKWTSSFMDEMTTSFEKWLEKFGK